MNVIHKRSLGSSDESTQSLLTHSYFIAGIVALALVVLRVWVLRRRNRSISDFFRVGGGRSQPVEPPQDPDYGGHPGVQLTPLPAAYRSDRRTRAADTDAYGRRLGVGEDGDGKDALPAYDGFDRPPKYAEASWQYDYNAHPYPPPEAEQSGLRHPNSVPGDDGAVARAGLPPHPDVTSS